MTNKEAIRTLEANYPDACFEQLREAVDAAIEALKAQEQLANNSSELDNNIGDLIRRSATIDAVCKAGCGSGYCGISCDDVKAIEQLPSAQPERPKGQWTYICNSDVNGLKIVECSKCHKRAYGSGNYCHNCGAEMVKGWE